MRFAPYVAFVLSGLSSLIFQTIWSRMLHHVFGATSLAISTVLTAFMAGLGIGTWISGRYAARIKHPIFTYAIAELGVAACGLIIPSLVDSEFVLADINAWLRNSLGAESTTFMLARFLVVAPVLLVPTFLMGTSLPLLSQHFARHEKDPGQASALVGGLYAVNTFGAALGPVLAGFVLMPNVGLQITNWVACSLNIALALLIVAFREQLIGSKWGSGVRLEILPGAPLAETAIAPSALEGPVEERSSPESRSGDLEEAGTAPDAPKKMAKRRAAPVLAREASQAAAPSVARRAIGKSTRQSGPDQTWVPPIARKMAFLAFALSGASALCYEVVWSRALAMTIGSSIYSFTLILETFLIGIAGGAAAMSSLMARGRAPLGGIAAVSGILTLLAMTPWAIDIQVGEGRTHAGDLVTWFFVSALPIVLIGLLVLYGVRRLELSGPGAAGHDPFVGPALIMLAVPLTSAVLNAGYFNVGFLPKIIASVVACIAGVLGVAVALRRQPVVLLALIQIFIAIATTVGYVWQDEIPYAFAQLVVSIDDLPDHVGTVQFFMFVTAALCTLPATLGMGAMFPLTMRVWTAGGDAIGRDVAVVYTGNTLGSIVGSWLPGFVLMPLIGMERTLHVGIALNMLLALGLLIAGAAEPDPEKKDRVRSPFVLPRYLALRAAISFGLAVLGALAVAFAADDPTIRSGAWLAIGGIAFLTFSLWSLLGVATRDHVDPPPPLDANGKPRELPSWHAVIVYVLSPAIPALLALLYLGTAHADSIMRWNLTQMTLGVFRVSLAEGMLDPESWGQPDLVFYRDGLSTTVSVERWGRHYALKNNGKVDASNGDDMPTQITVAAYPMLMHQDGPEDLDVAVIGFGSGVTVGTALSFPIARLDVIELERSVPEAARFFQDVNLLEYELDRFPFVQMDRLEIINDDGRNYLASTDRQYDLIISEPSNPWITGVSDLFTTDHFRITKQRLRPNGIYCQWVQLYELSPENIKTIYRTFAQTYRYVMVLAADDRSSDTVMLGSDAPLAIDLERLRAVWDTPRIGDRMSVRDQLERAYLHTPFDVYARVLLSSRDEVMNYTEIEYHRQEREWREGSFASLPARIWEYVFWDPWRPQYGSTNDSTCELPRCMRRPAVLNTDDNARIEFAAPRDLIGYERFEGYLGTIYSPDWPYGQLDDQIRGFGEGDERARNLAELAMSLIGHGRYELAARFIEQSTEAGRAQETAIALEVLTHLLTSEHEPRVRIEPPLPGPEMDRASAEQLTAGFDRVRQAIDRAQWGVALSAMEDIPAPLRLHSGPAMRFLYGYLLYKAADGSFAQYRAAGEQFDELVRTEESYIQRHPEVFYFLARSRDAEGEYDEALRNMRFYVEARLTASHSDALEVPEPPEGEAPTTDAPGQSDKLDREEGS